MVAILTPLIATGSATWAQTAASQTAPPPTNQDPNQDRKQAPGAPAKPAPAALGIKPADVRSTAVNPAVKGPEVKPGSKPEVKPGSKPEVKPGNKPDVKPGRKAEDAGTGPRFTIKRTASEIAHFKAFDAAIANVRNIDLGDEQFALVKSAFKAIEANEPSKIPDIVAQIRDPAARKLVDWFRLRQGWGQLSEYEPFLEANPAWPDRNILMQRLEELTFSEGGSAASIKARFEAREPRSGMGHAALASADLAVGETATARNRAVRVWRDMTIPAGFEIPFLDRFGNLLTENDHQWRLDRMIVDDIRSGKDRGERMPAIRRQIERLKDADARKRAEARLMVYNKAALDDAKFEMLQVLSDAPKSDYGFLYHRIQLLRRHEKFDDAIKLLQKVPVDANLVANLDEWWDERRILAYNALNRGNAKLAYSLVKDAGPLSVNPAKEQAFMAGWLAMRFLNDRKAAKTHFEQAQKAADGPLSRARAGYWLGRLSEAESGISAARDHYQRAAKDIDTFYGQLARLRIEPQNRRIDIKLPPPPTPDQIARFNRLDAIRAAQISRKAGLDPAIMAAFLNHFRSHFETDTEIAMGNHLAVANGDIQMAVRSAKSSIARGQDMLLYSYPLHTFPSFSPLGKLPEPAVILAITRQETEFNKNTVSVAGAKGLMQVMTVTANHVCKDYKITCELDRLLPDAAYNATIASSYIGDRMDDFRGSYALTMSGFNAGPGRTRQWMGQFGDPRDPGMDPIDWIERIPFQETREYVSKVLSNVQIYRARLGNEANALQLDLDLVRGRGGAARSSPTAAAASDTEPSDGGQSDKAPSDRTPTEPTSDRAAPPPDARPGTN